MKLDKKKLADAADLKLGLQEIIAILLLPAITYGITYTYENAYAASMGIPLGFVEPDKAALIKVASFAFIIIAAFSVTVFLAAGLSYLFTKSLKWAFIYAMIVYSILAAATSYAYGHIMHNNLIGLVLGFITLGVCLVIFFKSYRIPKHKHKEFNVKDGTIINWSKAIWLVIIYSFIMFVMLAEVAGKYEAKISGSYNLMTYKDSDYLLLRTYGSNVVLGCYKNGYLTRDIILVSKQDLYGITIRPYNDGAPKFIDDPDVQAHKNIEVQN
ncbi:hypothetical protein KS4_04990 [Poriferisphaera corsica]|uniref:Uncharacterized protein n=1 Tax=Poriferisphaera corsica TaxID=2528020 RepID=A0A517YQH4_9BACT|nr:hypothetical protein [Poriferisphaera corsica]QDU32467.1 hypothetical protein KS4_04990 [Poriferisphaera corsica]